MVLWGRSFLSRQEVPQKVPPRLRKFRGVFGLLGQIRLGLGCAQGSTKVSPRFRKFRRFSDCLEAIRLGLPKGSGLKGSAAEGSPRFHQGFTKVHQGFTKVAQAL